LISVLGDVKVGMKFTAKAGRLTETGKYSG